MSPRLLRAYASSPAPDIRCWCRPAPAADRTWLDAEYVAAGATIVPGADDVWAEAELILKVKEPIAEEYGRIRAGQTLFTYLHLAASRECTDALLASGATAIAYETVQAPTDRCHCSPR